MASCKPRCRFPAHASNKAVVLVDVSQDPACQSFELPQLEEWMESSRTVTIAKGLLP